MNYYHWLGREADDHGKRWTYYGPCFPPEGLTFPPVDNKTRESCLARYDNIASFRGAHPLA